MGSANDTERPAVWAAIAFLMIASPLALALFGWLLRVTLARRSLLRGLAALLLVPAGTIALFLVPYIPSAVRMLDAARPLLLGPGLLMTRYLDVCLGIALSDFTWLAFPVVLAGMFAVYRP